VLSAQVVSEGKSSFHEYAPMAARFNQQIRRAHFPFAFSPSTSWPFCSRWPFACVWLARSVLISGRSKLCPFSSGAAPRVARPPRASMVGLWGAGRASFCFRLQPELDQPADGFGAADLCILHSDPGINSRNLLIVHKHDLRSTGDRILHNAAE